MYALASSPGPLLLLLLEGLHMHGMPNQIFEYIAGAIIGEWLPGSFYC